jgi:hypothetical protein
MTFDGAQCVATFTTPVQAFCPYTITRSSKTTLTLFYESTIRASSGGETIDRTTIYINITTLTFASAVAQPLWVLWQSAYLFSFPPAYTSSLAKRINVPFTATATASSGSSSSLPAQISPPLSPPQAFSTVAKVSIGVGVSLSSSSSSPSSHSSFSVGGIHVITSPPQHLNLRLPRWKTRTPHFQRTNDTSVANGLAKLRRRMSLVSWTRET